MTGTLAELDHLLAEDDASVRRRERGAFENLLAEANRQVVLFGAGYTGRTALRNLRQEDIAPVAFADNSERQWGTTIEGVPVISPSEAAARFGASALFVVTIWSLHHNFRETKTKLEELGVKRVVSVASLRWRFPEGLLPFFCQDFPHKLYAQKERVTAAAKLWADPFSLREYVNQVRMRGLGDFAALSFPVEEESYFPSSLFQLLRNESFVDCGAYTGDTAQRLLELTGGSFHKLFEVEPDPTNFAALQKWRDSLPADQAARISLLNFAVGSSRCQVRFTADGTEGATISDRGSIVVECHRLDDVLADEQPTYIKMDIEGAEPDALDGARDVIRRCKPVLAICLYHQQDHLWEIPLKVASFAVDYRFYLRPHDVDGWQTVMYAVPASRDLSAPRKDDQ